MTPVVTCPNCQAPTRFVGGFRVRMDAEPTYFVIESNGMQAGYTDRGECFRGRFGKVEMGKPWAVAYRAHHCETGKEAE